MARMMCFPRGVQKLSSCSPGPLREVETEYVRTSPSLSSSNSSVCARRLIRILGISGSCPLPGEKIAQQRGAFFSPDPGGDTGMVIEPGLGEQVDHAAAGAGLGVGCAVDQARDTRMQHGAYAHHAGFQGDVKR